MSLPNKASNLPTNAAVGADSSAPAAVQASTTGSGTGWPPHQPYVSDVITTDKTFINDINNPFKPTHPLEKLLYALGIHILTPLSFTTKCSSCKEEKEIIVQYGSTITRSICKVCLIKLVDKAFNLNVDADLEAILYDKTYQK